MAYQFKNLKINKLSVIGAGQIGPDICLHFAKVFAKDKVDFVLIDISPEALSNAKSKIEKKISKGVETGAFKLDDAERMRTSITYSSDYSLIKGSEIVLEAATEDGRIKDIIFKQVEALTDDSCLFLSNSSHMTPEVIFRNISNKKRCLVTHYFFPADRNPVVEVVPGKETSTQITSDLLGFYEAIGKVPIEVKSSYGYAIDPIFEGLCELAILCLEKGYGSVKEIDKIAQTTLQQGVGPFKPYRRKSNNQSWLRRNARNSYCLVQISKSIARGYKKCCLVGYSKKRGRGNCRFTKVRIIEEAIVRWIFCLMLLHHRFRNF